MGIRPQFRTNSLYLLFCLLLLLNLCLRWWDASPVEATRISGRETDAAFNTLAQSNRELANSNRILAQSLQHLTTQLGALKLDAWARAQTDLAEAQKELSKGIHDLSSKLDLLLEKLVAAGPVSSSSDELTDHPESREPTEGEQ